ncbi:MAG: alpha-L-rhamnosidase family protein, partial [Verrucomicrobiales bacterium]|nr:alpha-L-rhamnosidase family protein [Verrucomicrobiales bacterium]
FNVVQIVAGLYPDMFPFDPRGANEGGYPWETNYTRINPKYFDAADKRLLYLVNQGISPCIVGAWGYFLPWMGVEKAKQHWRYLIARYGALPVTWCVAGEVNLPWYLAKGFPYDDREQAKGWTEVARYVRETDPFHRMLTMHPTGIGPCDARHAVADHTVLDYNMLQTPHGQREAVAPTLNIARAAYETKPTMAILNGEASYERLNDTIASEWTRAMFWISMMNGAAGHTYGANGIWQCNRREQPHGASPHGGTYGKISWDEAMELPGSSHVGFGKEFLEDFAWRSCVPMHSTVSWATANDAPIGPLALGHTNDMRIIYAIVSKPVVVTGLRAKTKYHYTAYDPVGGNSAAINDFVTDEMGKLTIEPPTSHDWVAVLETVKSQIRLEPLLVNDEGKVVVTPRQWNERRAELKRSWEQVLGKFPSRKAPLRIEVLNRETTPDFIREHIRYQIEDGIYTDAYLLTPKQLTRKNPAVVVFHPTTQLQAKGVAGLAPEYAQEKWQGVQLVKRGYVVLCPRNYINGEGADWTGNVNRVKARHPNWTGITEMTWEAIRAADLLQSLPQVDKERIGCIGHSLGGKQALYAAAFDERYKACVASEFGIGLNFSNWNDPWYFGGALNNHPELDNYQVLALVAPRPFLLLAGDSADTDNSLRYIAAVAPVYDLLEAPRNLQFVNHRAGHRYSPEARSVAEKFLDTNLKK